MDLEIQNIRKMEHLSIKKFAQILKYETNMAKCNIHFHQCFGYGPYKTFC